MKFLYKYTTRSRPHLFKRGLESIISNLSGKHESIFLVSIDDDDITMNKEFILSCFPPNCEHEIIVGTGKSKSKIDAINRDMDLLKGRSDWHVLVCMSDDMIFTRKGFDKIIAQNYEEEVFLHFPDGKQSILSTLSIISRKHYERFSYIYHPSYITNYCDVEAQEVAKKLGVYKFVNVDILRHLHVDYKLAERDELYKRNLAPVLLMKDQLTYMRRKQKSFPTEIIS